MLLLAWVWIFITGEGGWLDLQVQKRQLEELQARVDRLSAQTDSLQEVLWRLRNDPEFVEQVAREDYGMVKPGERIYRIKQVDGSAANSK